MRRKNKQTDTEEGWVENGKKVERERHKSVIYFNDMSLTDCFIGLCKALSHSPWQCVQVCACQYVYVKGKKKEEYCLAISRYVWL